VAGWQQTLYRLFFFLNHMASGERLCTVRWRGYARRRAAPIAGVPEVPGGGSSLLAIANPMGVVDGCVYCTVIASNIQCVPELLSQAGPECLSRLPGWGP